MNLLLIDYAYAFVDKVDGLEYVLRKINNAPIDKSVLARYDLYELYFENRSEKTFSIPGYSINLGVDYSGLADISSEKKNKSSKKATVFNIAAGAASIALGGIAKSAATTAMRSVGSFKNKNFTIDGEKNILSVDKTYIIYPGDYLSLYFFVDKFINQIPTALKYVCHDENEMVNYIVINKNIEVRDLIENPEELDVRLNVTSMISNESKNDIAVPDSGQYK